MDITFEAERPARQALALQPEVVRKKLAPLRLGPASRRLFEYWLSLSEGPALPLRNAFDPAGPGELLRGCALFDVVPGNSVRCRIAGTVLKLIFGPNIAGQDWLALAPIRHRAQRLARYSAVVEGAIGIARRVVVAEEQDPFRVEEIMLPFADVGPDGAQPVLVHTDWRPVGEQWFGVDPTSAMQLADDFFLVELD
jgi:hypothetical protein